jgi:hypothetical protein
MLVGKKIIIGVSGSIAAYKIAASEFVTFSDKRIKKNILIESPEDCLFLASAIEINKYSYTDTKNQGICSKLGVIAQDIENDFPSAVSVKTDYIPNVYSIVQVKDGCIYGVSNIKQYDKIKMIDNNNTIIFSTVVSVENDMLILDKPLVGYDEIFLYDGIFSQRFIFP